jgi:hypothetical protein
VKTNSGCLWFLVLGAGWLLVVIAIAFTGGVNF